MLKMIMEISQAETTADYEATLRRCMDHMGFGYYGASYVVDAPTYRLPDHLVGVDAGARDSVTALSASYELPSHANPELTTAWHTVGSIPAGFEDEYTDVEAIRRDPVSRHARENNTPIIWSADTYRDAGAADLWEMQAPFGLREGVALAMHLPNGRHYRLSVESPGEIAKSERAMVDLLGRLQLMLVYAHAAAARLYEVPARASTCPLTPAQLVCLKWAAAGKTAWETGQIMGLSDSTVNKHLGAACRRLGCNSKVRAAAIAAQQGWLG